MNISELLKETSYLANYRPGYTFANKKFGEIYLYNKTVKTKPNSSIIEVSMMIKGVTDKITSKNGGETSVAAHKVMVAIHGVEQRTESAQALVRDMRLKREYSDKNKYSDEDLLAIAINPDIKPFKDKTIMPQTDGSYTIITDKISKNSEIRVWCSCSSYYWVFQFYNVEKNVDIFGRYPQRYTPKTKKGWEALQKNRPIRNPGRHPGMCKHILLLLALLMDSEVVAEARSIVKNYKANIARFQKSDRLSQQAYDKLIKNYMSDHRKKLQQRSEERDSMGYAQRNSIKKGVGHWDSKKQVWVENSKGKGKWNKR